MQVSPAPTGQAAVRSHGAPQQQHVPEPRALPVSPPSLHHTPPHHHHYRSPALAQGGHQAGNGSSSLFTSLPIPVCRGVLAAPSTTTYQRAAHPQVTGCAGVVPFFKNAPLCEPAHASNGVYRYSASYLLPFSLHAGVAGTHWSSCCPHHQRDSPAAPA